MARFVWFLILAFGMGAFGQAPTRVVPTLSALDALKPGTTQPSVVVEAYETGKPFTFGPKTFRWDSTNALATNAIRRATGTGIGRWVHDWDGDAQLFGAYPGVESSLAISNALAARNDVYLPYGTYSVRYPIEVGRSKSLSGRSQSMFGQTVLQATTDHVGPAMIVTYDQFPTVKNLQLLGNSTVKATLDGIQRFKSGQPNESDALFENLMIMSLHTAISVGDEARSGGLNKPNIGRLVGISAFDLTGNGVELVPQDYLHYLSLKGENGSFGSAWPYVTHTNETYGILFTGNGATAQGGTMWGFKYGFGGGVYPRFNTHVGGWVEYCTYLANQPGGGTIYGTVHAPTTRFNPNDKGRWVSFNQSPSAPYFPQRYPKVRDHLKASLFFNEGSGNYSVDRSGNGNHATWPANAGYWIKGGPFGSYFRRTNSSLSLPANTVPAGSNVTAIVLARADPAASGVRPQLWRQLFSSNDYRAIEMVPESPLVNILTAYGSGGSDRKGVFLGERYFNTSSNEFAHYMMAWDATINTNYIRGVFWDDGFTNRTLSGTPSSMSLGVISSSNCWIDIAHVAVFDKALEASEVHDYLAWIYGSTKFREPFDPHFSSTVNATNGQTLIPNAPITKVQAASTAGATLALANGTLDGQRWSLVGASDTQVAVLPTGLSNLQSGRAVRLLNGVLVSMVWDATAAKWMLISEGGTPATSTKTSGTFDRYSLAAGQLILDPAGDGNMGTNWTQFLSGWTYWTNAWRFNSSDPLNNYAAITSPGVTGLRGGGWYRVEITLASPASISGTAFVEVRLGNATIGQIYNGQSSVVWDSVRCGSLSQTLQVQCIPGASGSVDLIVDSADIRVWSGGDVFGSATIPGNSLGSTSDRFTFTAFGDMLSTTNSKSVALILANASTNAPQILDQWSLVTTSTAPWSVGANLFYTATNQGLFLLTGGGTNRMGTVTLPAGGSWSGDTYLGIVGIQSVTNGILRLRGLDADLGFRNQPMQP